jgi:hypothetical protein
MENNVLSSSAQVAIKALDTINNLTQALEKSAYQHNREVIADTLAVLTKAVDEYFQNEKYNK